MADSSGEIISLIMRVRMDTLRAELEEAGRIVQSSVDKIGKNQQIKITPVVDLTDLKNQFSIASKDCANYFTNTFNELKPSINFDNIVDAAKKAAAEVKNALADSSKIQNNDQFGFKAVANQAQKTNEIVNQEISKSQVNNPNIDKSLSDIGNKIEAMKIAAPTSMSLITPGFIPNSNTTNTSNNVASNAIETGVVQGVVSKRIEETTKKTEELPKISSIEEFMSNPLGSHHVSSKPATVVTPDTEIVKPSDILHPANIANASLSYTAPEPVVTPIPSNVNGVKSTNVADKNSEENKANDAMTRLTKSIEDLNRSIIDKEKPNEDRQIENNIAPSGQEKYASGKMRVNPPSQGEQDGFIQEAQQIARYGRIATHVGIGAEVLLGGSEAYQSSVRAGRQARAQGNDGGQAEQRAFLDSTEKIPIFGHAINLGERITDQFTGAKADLEDQNKLLELGNAAMAERLSLAIKLSNVIKNSTLDTEHSQNEVKLSTLYGSDQEKERLELGHTELVNSLNNTQKSEDEARSSALLNKPEYIAATNAAEIAKKKISEEENSFVYRNMANPAERQERTSAYREDLKNANQTINDFKNQNQQESDINSKAKDIKIENNRKTVDAQKKRIDAQTTQEDYLRDQSANLRDIGLSHDTLGQREGVIRNKFETQFGKYDEKTGTFNYITDSARNSKLKNQMEREQTQENTGFQFEQGQKISAIEANTKQATLITSGELYSAERNTITDDAEARKKVLNAKTDAKEIEAIDANSKAKLLEIDHKWALDSTAISEEAAQTRLKATGNSYKAELDANQEYYDKLIAQAKGNEERISALKELQSAKDATITKNYGEKIQSIQDQIDVHRLRANGKTLDAELLAIKRSYDEKIKNASSPEEADKLKTLEKQELQDAKLKFGGLPNESGVDRRFRAEELTNQNPRREMDDIELQREKDRLEKVSTDTNDLINGIGAKGENSNNNSNNNDNNSQINTSPFNDSNKKPTATTPHWRSYNADIFRSGTFDMSAGMEQQKSGFGKEATTNSSDENQEERIGNEWLGKIYQQLRFINEKTPQGAYAYNASSGA